MQDFLSRISHFSPKRLALLADELNGRLEALEASRHAPIALVGIGCRFPGGADSPERYWTLLCEGRDAIVEVPAERWPVDELYDPDPDAPGRMNTRWGGFLTSGVDGFDPHFFGISPREAQGMDPQQRLLLEVAWEALEHAGIAADRLAGSRTAVFLGVSTSDYFQLLRAGGPQALDAYTASGTAHSVASGRLSYALGAQGPSLSIDTACSSSLVAVHEAVHSLRRGECSLALAGGVNLMLVPDVTIALSKAHMMAPDGRCKAFDARADGFVRGECCGMLVLKRLADAHADGDRIIAVIRGSAANQDGRSNGLTAPNGPAQEAVIREALADAGVAPHEIGFVEAHGTGTSLGDPIEVQALARVLGEARPADVPLLIGSVKANIGHLEAASGVAGLIKLALALQHGEIPGQLHFERPNPAIPWGDLPVRVAAGRQSWPAADTPRRGGVSSFGFSGTNVHVVLEAPPADVSTRLVHRPMHVLTVSARQPAALLQVAADRADWLRNAADPLADVAHTANAGRSHFAHRIAVVAATAEAARAQLEDHLAGADPAGVHAGVAAVRPPRIAFLFTGQGSQYPGMARELYASQPVFRAAIDRCDDLLATRLPTRLRDVVMPVPGCASPIDRTEYTQPALFAMEYALASMWMSWGVMPTAALGHSVGEYVAACIAGVFSLEDGLALVAERGRLMGALPPGGAMAAIRADEAFVDAALAPWRAELAIAALNGPGSVVVSGDGRALSALRSKLEQEGVKVTPLVVSHAFHSPLVEPMLDAFATAAGTVQYAAPLFDLVSNVTGELAGPRMASAAYWRDHVRAPVRFADGMRALAGAGCDAFLEIGPHPVLLGMGRECLPDHPGAWLPSLRRGRGDWEQLLESLAALYVRGTGVDWKGFDAGSACRRVVLPTYPFQRERCWVDTVAPQAFPAVSDRLPARVRDLLYEVVWRDAPAVGSGLPRPGQLEIELAALVAALGSREGVEAYTDFLPTLDALTTQYVVRALRDLGWEFRVGAQVSAESLADQLGVVARHRRLFRRLLEILAEDGLLVASGDAWHVATVPEATDPDAACAALLLRFPACDAELELTRQCATELASVLRGVTDPVGLLFPGGSLDRTERLYGSSPPAQAYNGLIADVVGTATAAVPADRPLRVLEIGAGTGSTTSFVLPRLPDRAEYTFTDVSPLFLNRARERFGERLSMKYRLLDIASDPTAQGFGAGSYDLVIAGNVLHATPDLGVTLGHVRRLLSPGGLLVLLEATAPQRFGDLTVGLLEGWWAFSDLERRRYALMPRPSWLSLLDETGFEDAVALPGETAHPVLAQQAVFVARAAMAKRVPGRWLVLPDAGGIAEAVAEELRKAGDLVEYLPGEPERRASSLRAALTSGPPCRGVLHMGALDLTLDDATTAEQLAHDEQRLVRSMLDLLPALVSGGGEALPMLVMVTRGAQATRALESADPAQAVMWGLSHVIALEHPELHCARIDLDPAADALVAARALVAELEHSSREDQIAFRADRRLVRRLSRRTAAEEPRGLAAAAPRADRTYLVTGGLRGLGLRTAEWLVDRGARNIVLVGRRPPGPATRGAIARMESAGARVVVDQADVSLRADVERVLGAIARDLPPLAGVMHAAGVLDDGALASQRWDRFATVMAPKVFGTWHLHTLVRDLDFFALFSSGASLAGSAGQANHAAANAFEDALAWYRQARGLPTVSINWGPWAEVGAAVERGVATGGFLKGMPPDDGLAALGHALSRVPNGRLCSTAQLVALAADWSRLAPESPDGVVAPLFSELAPSGSNGEARRAPRAEPAAPVLTLRQRLRATAPNRRRAVLLEQVRELTVKVLGLPRAEALDVSEPLQQLGLDSLMAVELRNLLGKAVGSTLPATITFDHPSVLAIVDYIAAEAFSEELATAVATAATGAVRTEHEELSEGELISRLEYRLDQLQPRESQ